jgi:non-ribosomal peptide synthetase component E (peptide arylation enzyme)
MQIHPFSAIDYQCDSAPESIAIIDDNNAYTLATLRQDAWQAVNGFKALGFSSKDRISLVCKNRRTAYLRPTGRTRYRSYQPET